MGHFHDSQNNTPQSVLNCLHMSNIRLPDQICKSQDQPIRKLSEELKPKSTFREPI
jgi:hypothetical protein